MYNLFWRDTSLPFTQKQVQINVPPGAIVTNAASLRLTGKGFTNYGKVQQENLLRLFKILQHQLHHLIQQLDNYGMILRLAF